MSSSVRLLENRSGIVQGDWFQFDGGRAQLDMMASTWAGNVTLQKLGPDGTTAIPVDLGQDSKDNSILVVAGPGKYRAVSSAGGLAGCYVTLTRIGEG